MTDERGTYCIIMTTCDSAEEARRIAGELVGRRLVACVQVTGIESTYRWQGEVTTDEERLLLLKTRRDRYDDIAAALAEVHPYDVPELVVVPVETGLDAYLQWIDESVGA